MCGVLNVESWKKLENQQKKMENILKFEKVNEKMECRSSNVCRVYNVQNTTNYSTHFQSVDRFSYDQQFLMELLAFISNCNVFDPKCVLHMLSSLVVLIGSLNCFF